MHIYRTEIEKVDITQPPRPYPECRTYAWERIGSLAQPVKFWQTIANNAKNASKNPRALIAWRRTLDYLEDVVSTHDMSALTPKQFKEILLLAASEAGWYQAPSGRKGFTATVEGEPDKRRCSGCKQIKDSKDFRAEASDKRKAKYNWGRDGKPTADRRLYTHALCSACRANKARKPLAKRGSPRGSTLRKQMEIPFKLSTNHIASWGDTNEADIADPRYYFHKMRLKAISQARATLNLLEVTTDPMPEKWQMLLPEDVRHRLHAVFQTQVLPMWSGKGRQPRCF